MGVNYMQFKLQCTYIKLYWNAAMLSHLRIGNGFHVLQQQS